MNAQQKRNEAALVIDLCNRIQRRAMKTRRVHISVEYAAHVEQLHVWARSGDHDYMAKAKDWPPALMSRYVPLDAPDTVEQLTAVLNEMIELSRKPL